MISSKQKARGSSSKLNITGKATGARAQAGESGASQAQSPRPPKPLRKMRPEAVGAKTRAAAALIVTKVEEGASLNEALPLYAKDLSAQDQALCSEIVHGTLRHRRLLLFNLKGLLDKKLKLKDRCGQNLMLCALYQLAFMRTPPHAAVSASVGAASLCRCKSLCGLINAVLRRFLREGAQLKSPDDPAVQHSFPDWLYQELSLAYGKDKCLKIMEDSNAHAPMFVRVEQSKIKPTEYLKLLNERGIEAGLCEHSPSGIHLKHALSAELLPLFHEGKAVVQDESAQLAAPLLELGDQPLRVLDCCAAPGGKSAHILDLNPKADLYCLENDPKRLESLRLYLQKLGREATTVQGDAAQLSSIKELEGLFDRILVDAPCSGTGVIRRHIDIKWLRRKKDLEKLCAVQEQILDAAASKLKPGGILVYTTCSILPCENKAQAEAFLKRHPDFKWLKFKLDGDVHDCYQRLPQPGGGDGFFYARFIREA